MSEQFGSFMFGLVVGVVLALHGTLKLDKLDAERGWTEIGGTAYLLTPGAIK